MRILPIRVKDGQRILSSYLKNNSCLSWCSLSEEVSSKKELIPYGVSWLRNLSKEEADDYKEFGGFFGNRVEDMKVVLIAYSLDENQRDSGSYMSHWPSIVISVIPLKAAVDKMAAKHGPNHILIPDNDVNSAQSDSDDNESDERENKNNSSQASMPGQSSQSHGGSSQSGEVPGGQSKGGNNATGTSPLNVSSPSGGNNGHSLARSESNDPNRPGGDSGETDKITSSYLSPTGEDSCSVRDKNAEYPADAGKSNGSSLSKSSVSDGMAKPPSGGEDENEKPGQQLHLEKVASIPNALTGRATKEGENSSTTGDNPAGDKETGEGGGSPLPKKTGYRNTKKGGGATISTAACKKYGGITAKMQRAGISQSLIREARKVLASLVDDGQDDSIPRWDWTKFIVRMKTFRSIQPARREEAGRPAILVLSDVSGSCLGFSEKSLMVAQAVSRLGIAGADVIAVSHSNGHPEEWSVNGKVSSIGLGFIEDSEESADWYIKNLLKFNIQAVIAIGDWDAEWLYHQLAEIQTVNRLIWLDNFGCNSIGQPKKRPDLFKKADGGNESSWSSPWEFSSPWSKEARRKTTYVVGCKSAQDFLDGIKLALK